MCEGKNSEKQTKLGGNGRICEYSRIFYKLHKFVTLTADVIFVNGNTFTIKSARKIKFVKVEHIPILTADQLIKSLNKVIKLYGRGGFIIHVKLMDMEFVKVTGLLGNAEGTITAEIEHVE